MNNKPLYLVSCVSSVLLHLLIIAYFFNSITERQRYIIPGKLDTLHAYVITTKPLSTQHKLYHHQNHRGLEKASTIHKTKSAQKKLQQPTTRAIHGKQLNQLVVLIYRAISNHKVYPDNDDFVHHGKVIVSFRLDTKGQINHIQLLKSSHDSALDQAALLTLHKTQQITNASAFLKKPQRFTLPIIYD